jgi:leucyl aminopeptidase
MLKIHFQKATNSADVLIYTVFKNKYDVLKNTLDTEAYAAFENLKKSKEFEGSCGQYVSFTLVKSGNTQRYLILGIGEAEKMTQNKIQGAGGMAYKALDYMKVSNAFFNITSCTQFSSEDIAAYMAFGMQLRSYRFDKYRTTLKAKDLPKIKDVTFGVDAATQDKYKDLHSLAESIYFCRDLVTEPANVINPVTYAEKLKELKDLGIGVEILDEKQMQELGMNTLLGVAKGSATPPRLVILKWNGGSENEKPIALVGKGVTFDTGGYSLKPSSGMETMKTDMAGSATVAATLMNLAKRKAKINVVGVLALVENMISGEAQRVSDVVKSYKGLTVEIMNTDAEGRLILADALAYAEKQFSPKAMIDLATLTGAIVISLGHDFAGLFTRDDKLASELLEDGIQSGDRLWRLPLDEVYESHIKSDIADIKNTGIERVAGSISAAEFLRRFVDKTPWAHLDVAGVDFLSKESNFHPKGATGFGVRLLDTWLKRYEQSSH